MFSKLTDNTNVDEVVIAASYWLQLYVNTFVYYFQLHSNYDLADDSQMDL